MSKYTHQAVQGQGQGPTHISIQVSVSGAPVALDTRIQIDTFAKPAATQA